MYYIFGCEAVQNILRMLCAMGGQNPLSASALSTAYNSYLSKESIIEVPIDWHEPRFVDFHGLKKFAPTFCREKEHHFAPNSEALHERLASGYFDAALLGLSKKAPDIACVARFCIRLVVINQLSEYTNGTTEDTLGVANFNFRDDFDELDFQELLVHQLVHMLLFIDDTLIPHMVPEHKDIPLDAGLPSVLGGTAFPAYIAFHSYIVAVEMLLHRDAIDQLDICPKYHRSTARVIRLIKAFGRVLGENISLFTQRGREILTRAEPLVERVIERIEKPQNRALD